MKRLLAWLVALMVGALLLVWSFKAGVKAPKFVVGVPLPSGKVAPQLVSTWDTAVLLAPDGSLWGWGGNAFQPNSPFPTPGLFSRPRRIGSDSNWRRVSS